MISARQLEVLSTVIEVGTTSGAAELLSVSQPAVSNMIRHTEDLVGFPLFHREHGRLMPTTEALHIAQEAQHLFMQQRRVETIVNELRGGTIGRLNIVATPSIGHGILAHALSKFMKERPKLKLSIELGSIDEITSRLFSGRADLGLSITQPRHSALSVHAIGDGQLMCVCPVGHQLGLLDTVGVTDLNHTDHISYGSGTPLGQQIDKVFSEQGLERKFFCTVRHTTTALEMVRNGLGVALVDSFALIGQHHRGIVVLPTRPLLPLNMHAVTSNLFPTSNLALKFQSFLTELLQEQSITPTITAK